MFKVEIPTTESELAAYYHFRWLMLRKPWNNPEGSEKDEYDQVGHHRMIRGKHGDLIAIARLHYNSSDEAQIRHVAVSGEHQGNGLGRFIVAAMESLAAEEGVKTLVTNSRETSIAFFQRCGYEIEDSSENPTDMGPQGRCQMIKRLHLNGLKMHPQWCDELEQVWHQSIPISEQMGITLFQYTGRTLETRASLNKNVNLHGTMFAGSIFSLATLTAWGLIFLRLKEQQLCGDIVLGDGNIHYHKPVTSQPRALCHIESLTGQFDGCLKGKKCKLEAKVQIRDGEQPVAEFTGIFWVLPKTKNT